MELRSWDPDVLGDFIYLTRVLHYRQKLFDRKKEIREMKRGWAGIGDSKPSEPTVSG